MNTADEPSGNDSANDGAVRTSDGRREVRRISVRLSPDLEDAVNEVAARRGLCQSDAARRLMVIGKYVDDAQNKGDRVVVIEERNGKPVGRDVFFVG